MTDFFTELFQHISPAGGYFILFLSAFIENTFPPIPGEVLARVLAETGYAVSTGSACSYNKKGKRPKSMAAMKVPKEVAEGMIRISIGPTTTRAELEGFLAALRQAVDVLGRAAGR